MDLSLWLIAIGVIVVIVSFFIQRNPSKNTEDIEKISISLHQETNRLKKRVRAIEEELMISLEPMPAVPRQKEPVHAIIVNQILSLHSQGYSMEEIAKRSSLSTSEVMEILKSRGAK